MVAKIVFLAALQGASVQTTTKTQAATKTPLAGKTQARIRSPIKRPAQLVRHKPSYPAVELYAVNLNETLRWRPVDDRGRARKGADKELTRFLRCWHTGKQHRVDNRLGRVLYAVARHFPGKRLEIYSGYRPKAYCTREHSRHLTASAIDFHVTGVRNEKLIGWLRETFHPVGVGYYPNGVHVHLDVDRARDTYWVDAGDAPTPAGAAARPIAEIGDTAPGAVEATADEPVEASAPIEAFAEDPPEADPGIPE
ncbi:MAG TPA: DUF882 domain-containing protein [Polyangia bacterium]|nr:DUF882 domain-containing protein [Polyangia bacterium]